MSAFYLSTDLKEAAIKEIDYVVEKYKNTKFKDSLEHLKSIKEQMYIPRETMEHSFSVYTDYIEKVLPKKYKASELWPYIFGLE